MILIAVFGPVARNGVIAGCNVFFADTTARHQLLLKYAAPKVVYLLSILGVRYGWVAIVQRPEGTYEETTGMFLAFVF